MMIYVLLVGLIMEVVYCYFVFGKDLFSPSAIICEVFILSVLACIFNTSGFDYDIKPITAGVILGGNAVFIMVSTIVHLLFKKRRSALESEGVEELQYINVRQIILIVTTVAYLLFSLVFVVISMSAIKDIGAGSDFGSTMNSYRSETLESGSFLPAWLTRTRVVFDLGAFVLTYVFINNLIVNRKKKSNYLLLVSVLAYLASSVFTAQRTTILIMFIFALFVTYSLLNRKYQFSKRINTKYIKRGVLIVVVFLLLFGLTRGLFGRTDGRTVVDSVTYYMGNSIELLDDYVGRSHSSKQFGEELFRKPRLFLSSYGFVEEPTSDYFLEFGRVTRGNFSNVYTGYREYIHDFGIGSIAFFQAMMALFFGIWYEKLNCRKLKNTIDLSFILFAWIVSSTLFRFSIVNHFFTDLSYILLTHWWVLLLWKGFLNLKISTGYTQDSLMINNNDLAKRDITNMEVRSNEGM